MKILSTVWNLFTIKDGQIEVSRNGGSIMCHDICEYIGKRVPSLAFTGSFATDEFDYGNIHVLNNRKYLPLEGRTKDNINMWQEGLGTRFIEILEDEKPSFVFVHGGWEFSTRCMEICNQKGVPFAFISHLYIGERFVQFNGEKSYQWERQTFNDTTLFSIAVSTKMRLNILNDYPQQKEDHIVAIPNGTTYHGKIINGKIREKYSLQNRKILLCAGSLQPRKNQIQLIHAFSKLPEELKEKVAIILCGKDSVALPQKEYLLEEIKKIGAEKQIIYAGMCSREEMIKLYSDVDGLISPSLSEGLSLVMLEMLTYGKPIIMFSDNESAGDLNDKKAVILMNDHKDETVAEAIVKWVNTDWDEDYIKKYSEGFRMEEVADKYIEYVKGRIDVR